jgi:hypothetical protein
MSSRALIQDMLARRLSPEGAEWLASAAAEIGGGVSDGRFATLLSTAARHARSHQPLAPDEGERGAAAAALPGWDPERWTLLETLRAELVLARPDLAEASCVQAIEDAFQYADEGEACALYRVLAHLPEPQRFAARAAEGCRTNMRTVFEAAALDTPFPVQCFDDVIWHSTVIKCVFVGAPLWRLWGLDERLTPELARAALDLVEERRSAGRVVQPELWLVLGANGGPRGRELLLAELDPANEHHAGRRAAAFCVARLDDEALLRDLRSRENDAAVAAVMDAALAGATAQTDFANLCRPDEGG